MLFEIGVWQEQQHATLLYLCKALENLGCTRVSIFSSGGNQPLAEFLDVENPANAIWIKYSGAQG